LLGLVDEEAHMDAKKTLVIFYSRSGQTRRVARAIAQLEECDVLELREPTSRAGASGYLRSMAEAALRLRTRLLPLEKLVSDYDLVIVGSPVWGAALSSPVRTFLEDHRTVLPDVAFFVTCAERGGHRVLRQMEMVASRSPLATMVLRERDVREGLDDRVVEFVQEMKRGRGAAVAGVEELPAAAPTAEPVRH
jgi:menaquinone-dependent protoporphyrinogen IX oxidase